MMFKQLHKQFGILSRGFSSQQPKYIVETVGTGFDQRHFIFDREINKRISPWHDIDLQESYDQPIDTYTAFFEITRGTLPKMEVSTTEENNPVKQDTRKNKTTGEKELRFYGIQPIFNYGMFPQTWENNKHLDQDTQCYGDNDPLDVVELGKNPISIGDTRTVKVLGSICLIDQGELDWKILTINTLDAKKQNIKSLDDYNRLNPGHIKEIFEWFRMIKTYDGKPQNRFGHNEQVLTVEKTLEIICDNHGFYRKLVNGKIPNESQFWLKTPHS